MEPQLFKPSGRHKTALDNQGFGIMEGKFVFNLGRPNDWLFLSMSRTETDRTTSYMEKVHLA